MPLLKGKQYVGSNIDELVSKGHSRDQAIAIALKTAGVSSDINDANVKETMDNIDQKNAGGNLKNKSGPLWPSFMKKK